MIMQKETMDIFGQLPEKWFSYISTSFQVPKHLKASENTQHFYKNYFSTNIEQALNRFLL